jgi:protein SCO1/2
MSRTMKALLGVWIAALAAAAVWIGWDAYQGGKPAIGGPFALTDQDGRTVTSDSLKGKPTLIYFGFTYCPDVCPTSLLLMENAIEKLGPDAAKKVNLVFITIDPERDTPQADEGLRHQLRADLHRPHRHAAADRRRRPRLSRLFQKVPGKDGGPYLMDHSSIVYLLDRNGRFVTHFTHEAKAEQIAAAVQRLL